MKAGLMNLMLHGFIIEKFIQLIKKTTFIRRHCSRFVKKLSKLGQMSYFTSFENQTFWGNFYTMYMSNGNKKHLP